VADNNTRIIISADDQASPALRLQLTRYVYVLMAQAVSSAGCLRFHRVGQRLARWLLGQLHWMVPQGDQPVRTDTVARVAAHLARALPEAAPGTRVLPPDVLWAAAQTPASETVVDDWLAGRPLAGAHARGRW
jgi:hypothetical protein